MRREAIVVDLFAGAGGESSGIEAAANKQDMSLQLHAVNHWERAIETHSQNFPSARHYCEDVETMDPCKTIPGGRVDLLWASPSCTDHSNAKGGKPRNEQSRDSGFGVLKWLRDLYVRRLIVENIPEFLNWGPLGSNGKPLKSKRGVLFNAWIGMIRALGYRVEWRILNAADFGAGTTRRRLFIQAVRGNARMRWPTPTHVEGVSWIPGTACIDWSNLGTLLQDRRKPHVEATLHRIEVGIRRYWGEWAEPFIAVLRGTGTAYSLRMPLPAITAGGQHLLLCRPFLTRYNGSTYQDRVHDLGQPMPTIDCSNRYRLVSPFVATIDNQSSERGDRSLDEPLSTVVTKARHLLVEPLILGQQSGAAAHPAGDPIPTIATRGAIQLAQPFLTILRGQSAVRALDQPLLTMSSGGIHFGLVVPYYGNDRANSIEDPLRTITCTDRFGLVAGDTVTLNLSTRMLKPPELARATGFADDYVFTGNQEDQIRQIGNAVCPPVAEALAAMAFSDCLQL